MVIMRKLLTISAFVIISASVFSQVGETQDTVRVSTSVLNDNPKVGLSDNKMFVPRSIRDFRLYNSNGTRAETSHKKPALPRNIKDVDVSVFDIQLPHDVFYDGPPLELENTRFPFANDYNYSGITPLDNRSWVSGGSYHATMPTIGHITTATAMYNRMLTDKLLVSGGTTISKYRQHGRQLGETILSARAAYRFNDRMNLSVFGDYSVYRRDAGLGSMIDALYPEVPGQIGYGFRPVASAGMQFDYQITDWLEFNPGLYTERYEFFGNHFNDYGLNGHIGIRAHERVKFHMRGRYSLRHGNGSSVVNRSVMMNPQNMYGGGIEFKINQTISVEAGVNRELNPWTGKWETKPYVMPIFHIK